MGKYKILENVLLNTKSQLKERNLQTISESHSYFQRRTLKKNEKRALTWIELIWVVWFKIITQLSVFQNIPTLKMCLFI